MHPNREHLARACVPLDDHALAFYEPASPRGDRKHPPILRRRLDPSRVDKRCDRTRLGDPKSLRKSFEDRMLPADDVAVPAEETLFLALDRVGSTINAERLHIPRREQRKEQLAAGLQVRLHPVGGVKSSGREFRVLRIVPPRAVELAETVGVGERQQVSLPRALGGQPVESSSLERGQQFPVVAVTQKRDSCLGHRHA